MEGFIVVIVSLMIVVMMLGYILLYLTYVIPLFRLIYMDWIAIIVVSIPTMVFIMRLGTSKSLKVFEKKPVGKELIIWLRRDGSVIPSYASRPFFGESFLDLPRVGLIHDLGKGSVYRWGDKNVRFALENVNHTPDPTYVNYTHWLYKMGFDNMAGVRKFIDNDGKSEDVTVPFEPVSTLVTEMKEAKKVDKSFKPLVKKHEKHDVIGGLIDRWKKPKK